MKYKILSLLAFILTTTSQAHQNQKNVFPDGTPMSPWFLDYGKVQLSDLGKQYVITDFGARRDSTLVQTQVIQRTIDEAARQGGGVVVIPKGTFMSGALFFKPKTHLYVGEGAKPPLLAV